MVRLGALVLEERVGRGGMGTVWRARHAPDDATVAVKVVRGGDATALAEVAAVARLRHPAVVQVYDYGRVPPGAGVEGDAWIAMEWLPGGTLAGAAPDLDWPGVRAVLVTLLGALAHAHARGVVHRDLKPANVLRDAFGAWRLVDFGLARAFGQGRSEGTLGYMSPEQIRGWGWASGPASDLYSLGATAWELATGTPPTLTAARQLELELPPLDARMPVPEGFEAWCARLLHPDREERFGSAGVALATLPDGPVACAPRRGASVRPISSDTIALDDPLPDAPPPEPSAAAAPLALVPVPERWPAPLVAPPAPASLGLSLVGLTEPAPIGRRAEIAELWGVLCEVAASGTPAAVALTGDGGIGRRTVARAVARALDESGAGRGLEVRGGSLASELARAAHRLPAAADAALARLLPTLPGATQGVADAFRRALDDEVLAPDTDAALAIRLLAGLAASGPVCLVVGDTEATRALEARLTDVNGPVLLLAVRDVRGAAVRGVALSWLSADERIGVLEALLPFDRDAALALASRVGGSPDALVAAVRRLAIEGALEPGPGGFRLGPTADAALGSRPDPGAWLATLSAEDRDALRVASWLGAEVAETPWRTACDAAGCVVPGDLVDRAARAGWLVRTPAGFEFARPELRAALGPPGDDLRARRVAGALQQRHPAVAGELLLAAGHPRGAVQLLAEGASAARRRLAVGETLRLYELCERASEAAGRPDRAAFYATWRAWVLLDMGSVDEGEALGSTLAQLARERGWPAVEGGALHVLSYAARRRGDPERADALVPLAATAYRAGGEHVFADQLEIGVCRGESGLREVRRRLSLPAPPPVRITLLCRWMVLASVHAPGEVRDIVALMREEEADRPWLYYSWVLDAPIAVGDLDLAEEFAASLLDNLPDPRSPDAVRARLVGASARVLRGVPADDDVLPLLRHAETADANLTSYAWIVLAASAALRSDGAAVDERLDAAEPVPEGWSPSRCRAAERLALFAADALRRAGDERRAARAEGVAAHLLASRERWG